MTAIVLAGGFGTRLQTVVSDVPKPMAPVMDKPFLEYIFKYLKKNDISKVILSVGYKHEIIESYFGNKYLDINITYVVESEPLGTGGAIKKALGAVDEEDVFIINGDTFFDVDLSVLKKQFKSTKSQLLLSLKEMQDFDRYGCVEVDDEHKIIAFKEKEARKIGSINGGIYLIKSDIFDNYELPEIFSFEEFMQDSFTALNAMGLVFTNYFIDIGIPEDYAKAQIELKEHI